MSALVKMQREDGKTADVHPEQVKEFGLHGWTAVKVAKPAAKKKSERTRVPAPVAGNPDGEE